MLKKEKEHDSQELPGTRIPFNRPWLSGRELEYIQEAVRLGHLSGDGSFTKNCHRWLEERTGAEKALLTHSCTAALEMSAILGEIEPGDEVIMPSFTFVSTANAFVLRSGIPVFVDIRPDTKNIDEKKIEEAITGKTKAIVPVHYAGVSCEMDTIMDIARRHNLLVVEDAAQGIMSAYRDKPLGSIGHLGCLSFHETKNIISGEGGAILINSPEYIERGEIVREKGTNRSKFFRGQVDKYTWVDIGSSFLPGELIAAFLWAQMKNAEDLTRKRLSIWNHYHEAFEEIEQKGMVQRPIVPDYCTHNAHMYYLILEDLDTRTRFIEYLKARDIFSVFHYVPLHSSPAGMQFGRVSGTMKVTDSISRRLVRLPLWPELESGDVERIIETVRQFFTSAKIPTIPGC